MKTTVGKLISTLEQYPDDLPVVIEAAGIGTDDRSEIHDVDKAMYEGMEELHIVAEGRVNERS